jgi:hypothetical protein
LYKITIMKNSEEGDKSERIVKLRKEIAEFEMEKKMFLRERKRLLEENESLKGKSHSFEKKVEYHKEEMKKLWKKHTANRSFTLETTLEGNREIESISLLRNRIESLESQRESIAKKLAKSRSLKTSSTLDQLQPQNLTVTQNELKSVLRKVYCRFAFIIAVLLIIIAVLLANQITNLTSTSESESVTNIHSVKKYLSF